MVSISSHIGDFKYDRDRGRFRNWVRTITENKIRELWRKRSMPNADSSMIDAETDGAPSLEEIWEEEWKLQDLLWCLDQVAADIAPRKMEAFRKYALEGVPAQQVAQDLNMSVGNVYVTRHMVLSRVRQKAAELEDREAEQA